MIDFENRIYILTDKTVDELLIRNPDSVSLYLFYYQKAKIDKTNRPYCTNQYCMKGLGWGEKRFYSAKGVLDELDLVESYKDHKSQKWFIHVKYLASDEKYNPKKYNPTKVESTSEGTNALSNTKLSALSNTKEINPIVPLEDLIEKWNNYKLKRRVKNTNIKIGDNLFTPCRGITKDLSKVYKKLSKDYPSVEFEIAFENYAVDRAGRDPNSDFSHHRFSLYEFLKQSNGFSKFVNR